jgi:hypothetical protein
VPERCDDALGYSRLQGHRSVIQVLNGAQTRQVESAALQLRQGSGLSRRLVLRALVPCLVLLYGLACGHGSVGAVTPPCQIRRIVTLAGHLMHGGPSPGAGIALTRRTPISMASSGLGLSAIMVDFMVCCTCMVAHRPPTPHASLGDSGPDNVDTGTGPG